MPAGGSPRGIKKEKQLAKEERKTPTARSKSPLAPKPPLELVEGVRLTRSKSERDRLAQVSPPSPLRSRRNLRWSSSRSHRDLPAVGLQLGAQLAQGVQAAAAEADANSAPAPTGDAPAPLPPLPPMSGVPLKRSAASELALTLGDMSW